MDENYPIIQTQVRQICMANGVGVRPAEDQTLRWEFSPTWPQITLKCCKML